ncbi:MAG: flagellar hook protein FlgE [Campylobacteraceae bacterium]|nr:flagellar hook protein FlgE [Campylobacteraceae bacterium]
MNSSFYNGISGVKTHQFGIDVWADNISNVNTIGFKSSTPEFSTIFSSTLSGNYFEGTTNNIGYGSKAQTTGLNMSRGNFQNSDNVFDLSLGNEGWFGVQGAKNANFYTRAGSFSIDANGNMVDANGNYLLGTSANNTSPTSLPQKVMDDFGLYYGTNPKAAEVFRVTPTQDITLSGVDNQDKITLPDYLYYPPTPTQNIRYKGNLDPKITIGSVNIDLHEDDITLNLDTSNALATISGGINNTTDLLNPKKGDLVNILLRDSLGGAKSVSTYLDENLLWSFNGADIADLNLSEPLNVSASLYTDQEIANIEKFTTSIISPDGEKDTLSMIFTKQIPQPDSGNIWDGVIQVHSFYENLERLDYDSNIIYDPNKFTVFPELGYVQRNYDPSRFFINESEKKVYEIIDNQTAQLRFGGAGQLVGADMPTINNSGAPISIDIGNINNFDGLVSSVNLNVSRSVSQDGHVAGLLKDYGMDERGNVVAEFTNGKSVPMAKIAVYHFQNDQGLTRTTSTLFQASSNSGNPIFYTDINGNFIQGSPIFSNRLEGSNVNLGTALTELIVMQKAFDASAKSITTSDEMIKNAIQMKR